MNKLLVVDLDGTILGGGYEPYARIPDPMSDFLDDWTQWGGSWAINSTWSVEQQIMLLEVSATQSTPRYLMTEMGLGLYRMESGRPRPVEPYCTDMIRALWKINHDTVFPIIKELCENFRFRIANLYGHLFEFMPELEDQQRFDLYLARHHEEWQRAGVHCLRSDNSPLTLHHEYLHKGRSLRAVMELDGWKPEQVVVAGDSLPDLAMMETELCGLPVCPENAHAAVRTHVSKLGIVGKGIASRGILDALSRAGER